MNDTDNLPMHNAVAPGMQGEFSPSLPTQDKNGTNSALVQGSCTSDSPCAGGDDLEKVPSEKENTQQDRNEGTAEEIKKDPEGSEVAGKAVSTTVKEFSTMPSTPSSLERIVSVFGKVYLLISVVILVVFVSVPLLNASSLLGTLSLLRLGTDGNTLSAYLLHLLQSSRTVGGDLVFLFQTLFSVLLGVGLPSLLFAGALAVFLLLLGQPAKKKGSQTYYQMAEKRTDAELYATDQVLDEGVKKTYDLLRKSYSLLLRK